MSEKRILETLSEEMSGALEGRQKVLPRLNQARKSMKDAFKSFGEAVSEILKARAEAQGTPSYEPMKEFTELLRPSIEAVTNAHGAFRKAMDDYDPEDILTGRA